MTPILHYGPNLEHGGKRMIMHQPHTPHNHRPQTVEFSDMKDPLDHGDLIKWLSTAREWSPDTAQTWVERLRKEGVRLPNPDVICDQRIGAISQRLIVSLAERGVYLAHTDHLTDRELYAYLIDTALAIPAPPRQPGAIELIDLCPPYGKGIELMLACYASDDVRSQLSLQGVPIPPRQAKPARRDGQLPRPLGFPEHLG